MQRTAVESSNLASVGYDKDQKILEVEFKNKSVYQYYNVDQKVYDDMIKAESVGKFFASQVKNKFKFGKYAPSKPKEALNEGKVHPVQHTDGDSNPS